MAKKLGEVQGISKNPLFDPFFDPMLSNRDLLVSGQVVGNAFIGKSTKIQVLAKALSKLRQEG